MEMQIEFYSDSIVVTYIHSADSSSVEATIIHYLPSKGEDQLSLQLDSPYDRFRREPLHPHLLLS